AAGQTSDGLHLLRLPELPLHLPALSQVIAHAHYSDDPLLIVVNRIACEIHKFCAVVSGAQSDFASPRMTLQIAFANLLSQHRIYDDRGESTDAVHGIDVEPGHLDECRVVMQRCSRRVGDYDSVAAGIDCRSDSPEPLF